ncbi:hypothetical protein DERP_008697 [Dermatophagoides pteronyssinus]|uniref:Transmembrane protein n=1 Tax=Dermatophagoides pteronyssinus TaxID=6956 RepID=A0ABQ8IW13_DERPT|nr:hypothetical protein DERP_008697 [Dermatophagoides pteronyssinus]
MAQIYRSRLIITTIFFIITTTLISTNWSLPITSSSSNSSSSSSSLLLHEKSSSSPFCQSHSNINQVYNIGQDIYLSLNSRTIYRFNVKQKKFYQHKYDINELFGKIL